MDLREFEIIFGPGQETGNILEAIVV